jgi:hypothetical protein
MLRGIFSNDRAGVVRIALANKFYADHFSLWRVKYRLSNGTCNL